MQAALPAWSGSWRNYTLTQLQSLPSVLGASTREAPSLFLFFPLRFSSFLDSGEEITHFGARAASVALWLCPRPLGGMPAWGMRCHPAAVTSLCPADLLCPLRRETLQHHLKAVSGTFSFTVCPLF